MPVHAVTVRVARIPLHTPYKVFGATSRHQRSPPSKVSCE